MKRTEIRELAFKLLYSLEIQDEKNLEDQIELYIENNEIKKASAKEYLNDIILGVEENFDYITDIIKKSLSNNWSIDRISKIDLSILRLAVYEIKFKDIPYKVEINEAIELAKKYGEEKSSKFINGALAKAIKLMDIKQQEDS